MKILILDAYFLPEIIAYTHLENDLITECVSQKKDICIICPRPTREITKQVYKLYKNIIQEELQNGHVKINRFPLMREGKNPLQRAFRYLLCNLKQYNKGKKAKDIDVVFGTSTPPTQGIVCAKIAKKLSKKYKKKVPFVYNLQDVFPDSLVTTGLAKKGSLIWKIGRKIENYTYKNADKIIVISESMKRNIIEKGVPEEKIAVVSNWIDTNTVQPVKKENNSLYDEFNIPKDKFLVVYAGNFGVAQGADIVLKAAEILKDRKDIHFVIFGGGSEFGKAQEEASKMDNVTVNPLLSGERVSEVYSLGDVALITCKRGVGNSGMPSKTWSIMACNTPIIASFDTNSELADILKTSNAGVTVEPENVQTLVATILNARQNKMQSNGREYVIANASTEICPKKYVKIIEKIVKEVKG